MRTGVAHESEATGLNLSERPPIGFEAGAQDSDSPAVNPIVLSLCLTVPFAVIGHFFFGLGLGFADGMTRQDRESTLLGYDVLALSAIIFFVWFASKKR